MMKGSYTFPVVLPSELAATTSWVMPFLIS